MSAFDLVAQQPWATPAETLETIIRIAKRESDSPEAVAAKLGRPLQNTQITTIRDDVAVVPITGPIFRYANLFTEISGATSLEILARDFSAAIADPAVKSVVLVIDSPGGQVSGIAEMAHMIHTARKPVVAYVDGMAASAAYWLAAAAATIAVSKTALLGSIGAVLGVSSRPRDGIVEIVSSQSPRKRPDVQTSDGRAQLQAHIDALAQVFIEDVADYRGVSVETVLTDFGQGDIRMGAEAVAAGMADRVSTLEHVIAGLAGKIEGEYIMIRQAPSAAASQPEFTDPIERAARTDWSRDATLRAEFLDNFGTYLAYKRAEAEGRVKVLHGGVTRV